MSIKTFRRQSVFQQLFPAGRSKRRVLCLKRKKPVAKGGYTFVGWYIAVMDENGIVTGIGNVFDLANDTVESELCNTTGTALGSTFRMLQLVAVFEDAEGNLVW